MILNFLQYDSLVWRGLGWDVEGFLLKHWWGQNSGYSGGQSTADAPLGKVPNP